MSYSSESYDDDDYFDSEDDSKSYVQLPDIVNEELKRRGHFSARTFMPDEYEKFGPASEEVMKALRDHVEAGLFEPELNGGYLDLVEVRYGMHYVILNFQYVKA